MTFFLDDFGTQWAFVCSRWCGGVRLALLYLTCSGQMTSLQGRCLPLIPVLWSGSLFIYVLSEIMVLLLSFS